ncbi:hypothetical protein CPLU01_10763 [Colletotrichum plurivorum]|uniref:Peptidase S8/S53 domain-containing protein n=1 Tax=Colletotrichum plurivorum TaxID=2175906 RepID=A0A8H6K4Y2_9PEZI|nr:hypothetical protein CPLU01_10763 [Colletotrichum plurivorum]
MSEFMGFVLPLNLFYNSKPNLDLLIDIDWAEVSKNADDAKFILKELCDILEPLCSQLTSEPHRRSGRYVNLRALLEHLEDSSDTFSDIISTSGYPSALFCYPKYSTRAKTIEVVKRFNGFLTQLSQFTPDIDAEEPIRVSLAKTTPSVEGPKLSNFQIKSDGSGTSPRSTNSCQWQEAQVTFNIKNDLKTRLYYCTEDCCTEENRRDRLKPDKSLQALLDADFLKPAPTVNLLLSTHLAATAAEKISLAVQILLGVLRYGSNMATWDSNKVFILATNGVHTLKEPPYISIVEGDAGASYLDLPNFQDSFELMHPPSRTFTKIAKLLIEIGLGECVSKAHMDTDGDSYKLWQRLTKGSSTAGKRPGTEHLSSQKVSNPSQRKIVTLFDASSQIPEASPLVDHAVNFFAYLDEFQFSFESFLERETMGGKTNQPIRIAILDTGVSEGSKDIIFDNARMKEDWCFNFVDGNYDVHDSDGHGTHCATLLRRTAPNAKIYVAKVFSRNEFDLKQAGNIRKAIDHAIQKWKVDVISMSFGLQYPSLDADMERWREIRGGIESVIESRRSPLFFAAAANQGHNEPRAFPSCHPSVFCVHASDGLGKDCGINPHHQNAENNIMTLGTGIMLYDDKKDAFVPKVGTSFATAIAAGMVASILDLTSRVPQLTERSKEALKTRAGMETLFKLMSESDMPDGRRYVVPWKYWKRGFWNGNRRGLDEIWANLDSKFYESRT